MHMADTVLFRMPTVVDAEDGPPRLLNQAEIDGIIIRWPMRREAMRDL